MRGSSLRCFHIACALRELGLSSLKEIYRPRAIREHHSTQYLFATEAMVIGRFSDAKVYWEGEPCKIDGFTFTYNFEHAMQICAEWETPMTAVINRFIEEVDGPTSHPDFMFRTYAVIVCGADPYLTGRDVVNVDEKGRIQIRNLFTGTCYAATYEEALEYIRQLMCAFDPPLTQSKFRQIDMMHRAYPHMLVTRNKITAPGDSHEGVRYVPPLQ